MLRTGFLVCWWYELIILGLKHGVRIMFILSLSLTEVGGDGVIGRKVGSEF